MNRRKYLEIKHVEICGFLKELADYVKQVFRKLSANYLFGYCMVFFAETKRRHFLILAGAFLILWALLFSIRPPTWDAISYYVYARSALFDQDLHFENDFQLSYAIASPDFIAKEFDRVSTDSGYVVNLFPMGNGLLWLPGLALLRLVAAIWPTLLPVGAPSGYELFFTSHLSIFSALLGFLAFWWSYLLARRVSKSSLALAAALTMMVATPLLHYQFRDPMYSHATAAFVTALAVFIWAKQINAWAAPLQAVVLGAVIGLAGLVRWQNLMYLALPALSAFYLTFSRPAEQRRQNLWRACQHLFFVGGAALLVFGLQMAVWKVLYGSFVTIPQGESFIDWRAPFLWPLLFSSFRGLLPWMPVFFLVVWGLLAAPRAQRPFTWPLLLVLLLEVYINASTRDWFAGAGFGPRRFTSELPILVIGYAAFLAWLPQRWRAVTAVILGLLLALHQWVLLRFGLAARIGGRPLSMTPTFRWEDAPLTTFWRDFGVLAWEGLKRPFDLLIAPDSPLDYLFRRQIWPGQHIGSLLTAAMFLGVLFGFAAFIQRQKSPRIWAFILAAAGVILIFSYYWILYRA